MHKKGCFQQTKTAFLLFIKIQNVGRLKLLKPKQLSNAVYFLPTIDR